MTDAPRHVYGPRALGSLVPALTRPAFRKRAPAAAQLMADWPTIIGPALAAHTSPRRFSAGRLSIACAGPLALELSHLAPQLIARINTHLGRPLVAEIRFTQDHVPESPAPSAAHIVPAAVVQRVDNILAALADGPLKDALAALGQSVHSNLTHCGSRRSTSRVRSA